MSTINRILIVAAVALASLPAAAFAADPFQSVSPIVLLLMDSSGSMEYDVDGYTDETDDLDVLAVPECPRIDGTYGKSRFIVATEVLTGSYVGYSCSLDDRTFPAGREDFDYAVPHVVANGTQLDNGLIDVTGRRFKFGVMTFDTVGNPGIGPGGGYSYGPETPYNFGARNESAPTGPFVKPVSSDDEADILARNRVVEAALLSTMPFGGTPIAPMLKDALYYFENDPDLQPYNKADGSGDMFYNCRSKNIVLISDGRSNLGEGTDGYQTSEYYAQQLLAAGVKVYVIGFQLPTGVDSLMDQIASAGGTTEAFIATDRSELAAVLSKILGNMESTIQSRTKVVVTSDTGNPYDRQYQFDAAFGTVDGVPGIRQGYLERSVFRCGAGSSPNAAGLAEVQSISDKLNSSLDAQRNIKAIVGSQMKAFEKSNSDLTSQDLAIPEPDTPGQVDLVDFSPTSDGVCGTGILGDAFEEQNRQAFRNNLIDFIRASDDSCRTGHKMGAIIHSTPVIQGHLKNIDVMIPSFKSYKARTSFTNRPTMLYVGSHDGLLHAFKIDRPDTANHDDWGRELWAVIPNYLLHKLKDLPVDHKPLMDGEPVVKDILLSRTLTTIGSPSEEADDWRSILVTGYGRGGRGYFALDVTDPTDPKFLWEISNEGRCAAGDQNCPHNNGFSNDFSRLGYTISRPALGKVFLGNEEVAVAVFGGGSGKGLDADAGKSVFVVRLDTGAKLEEFYADATPDNVVDDCAFGTAGSEPLADMVGSMSCYSTFPGTFITRCYIGDMAGRLWRVELGSQSTANWKLQYFYDPYYSVTPRPGIASPKRAPVLSAPGIAVKPFKNELVVVYGAGDTEAIEEFAKRTFIVSLTETDDPEPDCSPFQETACRLTGYTASLNWKMFFGHDQKLDAVPYDDANTGEELKGEKLMGSPVVYSNVTYFVTFAPDVANACNPGVGWVWGIDYFRHGDDCMEPVPMLDHDGNVMTHDMVKKVRIGGLTGASIPYGLTVARRPACFDGSSPGSSQPPSQCSTCTPLAEQGGGGSPEVIVQTSTQSTASADTIPSGANTAPTVAKMTRTVLNAVQSLFVGAWGLIFN
ncbi:MAG: hypothetical protein GXP54_10740 [Deltaproteobacteria bacterium]|nr:hypothetical protein [Deltaproteobacteria bacterium]